MNGSKDILKAFSCLPNSWLSHAIAGILTNSAVQKWTRRQERRQVQSVDHPKRILLIADVNIGDSVNIVSAAEALKHHFPKAQIDYVHNATASPLVQHHPAVSTSLPFFHNPFIPRDQEQDKLLQQARGGGYDFILNFCPFLSPGPFQKIAPVLAPLSLTGTILDAFASEGSICQIRFKIAEHIDRLFAPLSGQNPFLCAHRNYTGPTLFLPSEKYRTALDWLAGKGISEDESLIFFNPDASNRYNKIPESLQVEILSKILADIPCDHLLLGAGFNFEEIGRRVTGQLPGSSRRKIIRTDRSIPIDVYAAIADRCDVYITADTGPMHIVASRKKSLGEKNTFRNQTSVLSLFGPTIPRIYGYDSEKPGYISAGQKAPARVFRGYCPKKNLLCSLERILQKCDGDRCFTKINVDDIVQTVRQFRNTVPPETSKQMVV